MNPDPTFEGPRVPDGAQFLEQVSGRLVAEARAILARDGAARLAGVIVLPGADEVPMAREVLAKVYGPTPPSEPLIGLVPRELVDGLLASRYSRREWQEQGWQGQWTLPVLVSTRDGVRFVFLSLTHAAERFNER